MATKPQTDRNVSRTYRAAIRLGENYVTLEETITLPLHATDEEVAQAVALGWMIYTAQQSAIAEQIANVEANAPKAPAPAPKPASQKQRAYIDSMFEQLNIVPENQIAEAAHFGVTSWEEMTHDQASHMIDALKPRVAELEARNAHQEHTQREQRQSQDCTPRRQGPGRNSPDPARVRAAREVLHQAEQTAGIGRREAPEPAEGERQITIKEPDAPASDAQLNLIVRETAGMNNEMLQSKQAQLNRAADQKVKVNDLRNKEKLQALGLNKAQASAVIQALKAGIVGARAA
jgi:hypothetical protein